MLRSKWPSSSARDTFIYHRRDVMLRGKVILDVGGVYGEALG